MERDVLISAEVKVMAPDGTGGGDVVQGVAQAVTAWLCNQQQIRPVRVRVDHGPFSRICAFTDPNLPSEEPRGKPRDAD